MPCFTAARLTALLALYVLTGCDPAAPALADATIDARAPDDAAPDAAEATADAAPDAADAPADAGPDAADAPGDAGPDAAEAICIGAETEPLEQCVPPTAPDTACALRVQSGEAVRIAATFDAAGRLTSSTDGFHGEVQVFDATGQLTRWEWARERCLLRRTLYWREGDRVVRRLDEAGDEPKCITETFVGGVAVERIDDEGCDCEDTWFEERCDVEGGRRVRCEAGTPDGRSRGVETWTWTADGRVARQAEDFNSDGIEDHVETFEYDAAGRVTVEVETFTECDDTEGCTERRTWTYEDDLRRTTRRIDQGDDGSIERTTRTTVDEIGRTTLVEHSSDGGETWTVQAWIREVDGNRTTITRTTDDRVREVTVEETDDAGRLLSRTETNAQAVVATLTLAYDGDGRIIEERRTVQGDGIDHACAAEYHWQGNACPDLRVPTDADVTPLEPVFPVGMHCISPE